MIRLNLIPKLCTLLLVGMGLLVYVGPIVEYAGKSSQGLLGWINNYTLMITFLCCTFFLFALFLLSSTCERIIIGCGTLCFLAMLALTASQTRAPMFSYGGLFILFGAFSASLLFYIAGRDQEGFERRIPGLLFMVLPALSLPVAMIWSDPDAMEYFTLQVYGFGNVRALGYFTSAILALAFGMMISGPGDSRGRILLSTTVLIAATILFWSGSRGGLFALAIGLTITLAISRTRVWSGVALFLGSVAGGAGLSTLLYVPGNNFDILNRFARNVEILEQTEAVSNGIGEVAKSVSTNRIDLWEWALGHIKDAPWTGYGFHPMSWMREEPFNYFHTHNVVLEYWMSFGLVLGSLVLALAALGWIRAGIAARRIGSPTAIGFFAFISVIAAYGGVSATLFFPYHLTLASALTGLLIGWDVRLKALTADPELQDEPVFRPDVDWMLGDA